MQELEPALREQSACKFAACEDQIADNVENHCAYFSRFDTEVCIEKKCVNCSIL